MGTQLLATKLFAPPPTPGLVARPRLLSRLDGILHNRLTLVSAQAGFGKTTLVTQWLHARQPPVPTAWLSLEEADNEPVRFWEYVIAASKSLSPEIGDQALVLLHSSQPVPIESTLISLINDLVKINADFILVLDDYQFIHTGDIHQGLDFLLRHLPPRMHLVVTTRVDPPLSLAHYRGKGTLLEIRADDLRFTNEEAVSLLNDVVSLQLAVDDINTLNDHADGWVVGLKLVSLALQQQTDHRSFISGFTGTSRYIMDYLLDEVLKQQPREVYVFLLQTSVLERFNHSLCDAVTGTSSSQEMLLNLEKANLFLIPLDAAGEWYRYHHLFRDLLQHRFRVEFKEDGITRTHCRASAWFEANKLLEEAINHHLNAQNWNKAMDLIGTTEIQARWVGTATMVRWLQQVPLEILRTRPMRYINYTAALQGTGRQEAAKQHLAYLEQEGINDPLVQGEILHLHSAIALSDGDNNKSGEYAQKTLALLEPLDGTKLSQDFNFRVVIADASQKLSLVYYQQARFVEAIPLLERCLKTFREVGLTSPTCYPAAMLGLIMALCGKPREAIRLIQEAIGPFAGDPATVLAHVALGSIYYELNDLEKAVFHYEQEIKLIQLIQIAAATLLPEAYLYLSQAKMAMRDVQGARQALDKADQLLPDNPEAKARIYAFHATIAMMQGDKDTASRYFDQFTRFETVPLMGMTQVAIYMFQIRKGKHVLLAEEPAYYDRFKSQDIWKFAMLARIYQALASSEDTNHALEYLADALTMGKSQECIRTFIDFGAPMASLLQEAIARGIETEYAHKLLDIIEDEERWRHLNHKKTHSTFPAEGFLSRREIEVLKLMGEGLSNQQIATQMMISLNTAKTHTHHLFEKLEASDRLQAVIRARELKIL